MWRDSQQITRKLHGERGHNRDLTVITKDGSKITEENAKLARWREHFQQLFNQCDLPFFVSVDWLMRTVTQGRRQGIRLTLMTVLEHLDYADDVGLLFSKHQYAQENAECLSKTANTIGLKVSSKKTQVLRMNTRVNDLCMKTP